MENLNDIIAKNITQLRLSEKMTQIDLAEKLNYSDKAISKWERGESVPNISVLLQIAKLFNVSLDYLVEAEHPEPEKRIKISKTVTKRNFKFITIMSVLLVWLVATLLFVVISLSVPNSSAQWLAFIYALPASDIVWLILNSLWLNQRLNYLIISLLMWTTLLSIHLTFLCFGNNIWLIYLLGIPGQVIIYFWSRLKFKHTAEE